MRRPVFLSTFLLAAVLSPITLQPYTCGPPPEQARLAVLELRVGSFAGENTIEGFNPNVFSYDVRFPESESAGVLWVKTNHPSTMVDVEYDGLPVKLVGQSVAELDVPLGSSELTIHVTRQGVRPDARTYVVRILRAPVFACTELGIREAIAYGGGPNYFDCDGPTQVPTAAEIVIDNDVILDGEGNMIVDAGGGGTGGISGAGGAGFMAGEVAPKANGPHRVFYIPAGATAELIGFTVTGGVTAEAGGGILNAGTLTLANSVVLANTARFGGGIRNEGQGQANVIDTTVSNNLATQAAGGISNRLEQATMSLSGCAVEGNTATGNVGGIANGGTLTMNDTAVSGNEANGEAGGIRNNIGGTLMMTNMNVFGNTATAEGGGILNAGESSLENSTVSGNHAGEDGGGILNEGTLSLTGGTVTGNHADIGGGVRNRETGTLLVTNSSVSGNNALRFAGGLHNWGQMDVVDSVISNNEAGLGSAGISNWPEVAIMTLTRTTVSGNVTGGTGGGIGNTGMATLNETTISGNWAGQMGGGVSSSGTTTLNDSHVSANTSGGDGGGIMVSEGSTTLNNTDVSGNECGNFGGGLQNAGTVVLNDSFVSENIARVNAGGLANGDAGVVTLNNSTVSENTAAFFGGALLNAGSMTVTGTSVSQNLSRDGGGGIINQSAGTLTVLNSTVSDNATTVGAGGGILNEETGTLTVTRCTVSGNSAGTWTGGIRNYGFANVIDTTVWNNTAVNGAAGISNRPAGTMTITGVTVSENIIANAGAMTVTNTTVSTNEAGIVNLGTGWMNMVSATVSGVRNDGVLTVKNNIIDGECQLSSPLASSGGNVESPGNTCTLIPPFDLFDMPAELLDVGPLADNGGPTATRELFPGSVAIDFAEECVNAAGFPLIVDQRGAPRPYGPACDSGAFELGAVPLPRDLCTNDLDRAVYESLEYIDSGGNPSTCTDAANSIAADCALIGCPDEVAAVITCFPNCSPDVIAAFDQCVADCTEEATGLSSACAGCYGEWAGCGGEVCVPECVGGGTQPPCIDCLFAAGCSGRFDACSGLPGNIDCGTGGTGGTGGSGGTGGTSGGGGIPGPEYTQDFESLDRLSSTALGDDGWIIFGNVFSPDGASYLYGYGALPAPNGTGAFSSVAVGQGGVDQGDQQLMILSDYNNLDEQVVGNRVEGNTYRERPITVGDIGKIVTFSFDAKRGDINDASDQRCIDTTNPPCDSTAASFIKTIDPNAGFATTNVVAEDTTAIAINWDRYSISLAIDPSLIGQLLQVGFSATASNFEPSGVFYDNILVVLEAPGGTGGSGGAGGPGGTGGGGGSGGAGGA